MENFLRNMALWWPHARPSHIWVSTPILLKLQFKCLKIIINRNNFTLSSSVAGDRLWYTFKQLKEKSSTSRLIFQRALSYDWRPVSWYLGCWCLMEISTNWNWTSHYHTLVQPIFPRINWHIKEINQQRHKFRNYNPFLYKYVHKL